MKYKKISDTKNIKPDKKYKICQEGNPLELGTFKVNGVLEEQFLLFDNINTEYTHGLSIHTEDFDNYDIYEVIEEV